MGLVRHIGTRRLVTLAGGLAVLALLLSWSIGSGGTADAHIPHPGLNYSIEAVGQDDCDTTGGDAVCYIDPGTQFTVNVTLDELPSDIPSYEGFDVYLQYSGLTSDDDADANAYWPDCGFPASRFEAGFVAAGCAIGIDPGTPSTYAGLMLSNGFTCDDSGTISLVAGDGETDLLETVSQHHAEGEGTMETLDITCGSPPTATSTPAPATPTVPPAAVPTALPATGTAGVGQDGGVGLGFWLSIVGLVAFATAAIGAFGWNRVRSAR